MFAAGSWLHYRDFLLFLHYSVTHVQNIYSSLSDFDCGTFSENAEACQLMKAIISTKFRHAMKPILLCFTLFVK